jgi:hypothetical protein
MSDGIGRPDRAGSDDQRSCASVTQAPPLLHRLGVVFSRRAAVDDAMHARRDQMLDHRDEGVAVDGAILGVGRDDGRVDAFECSCHGRPFAAAGASPSGMSRLAGLTKCSISLRDSSQWAMARSAAHRHRALRSAR